MNLTWSEQPPPCCRAGRLIRGFACLTSDFLYPPSVGAQSRPVSAFHKQYLCWYQLTHPFICQLHHYLVVVNSQQDAKLLQRDLGKLEERTRTNLTEFHPGNWGLRQRPLTRISIGESIADRSEILHVLASNCCKGTLKLNLYKWSKLDLHASLCRVCQLCLVTPCCVWHAAYSS